MTALRINDVFEGRYRIDGILGEGGFGTVYLAVDVAADRAIALKVLKFDDPHGYEPTTQARIHREIRVVANLKSPHTVVLLDHGTSSDGLMFMVFEYVPGEDLNQLIERAGRLEPPVVIHILRQLLLSLREAHEAGVLHRDIKPQNVRVFDYGGDPHSVKLLDFGIARATDAGSPSITKTGEPLGTPRYMSPEQLMGKPLMPSSDIYSLGMLTLEMLAGSAALGANAWSAQFDRLRSGHVFSIPEVERIGAGLGAVIMRMTARQPEQRFGTAAAVLAALDKLLDVPPASQSVETPSTSQASIVRPSHRVPIGRLLAVLGVLLVGVVALGIWVVRYPKPTEESRPAAGKRDPGIITRVQLDAGKVPQPEVVVAMADVGLDSTNPIVCAPDRPKRGWGRVKVESGFTRDSSIIYVPTTYDPATRSPLVIVLHQVAETPETLLPATKFEELAERDGWLLLAPESTSLLTAWTSTSSELGRIVAFLEQARRELCIDDDRIFVVGHGQGARMAHSVGCEPWVAAVASNSFRPGAQDKLCDKPKPLLVLSPLDSPGEPVEGGSSRCIVKGHEGLLMSLADAEAKWGERNGCKGAKRRTARPECVTWDCEAAFQSCRLKGGHGWPGTPPRFDPLQCDGVPPDFPTGPTIWEFFRSVEPRGH